MMEKMNEALEELKRVDHLIYVSLKYTRTVDVIKNILNRMVDSYSLMIDALIIYATEKELVSNEPESAIERAELVERLCAKDELIVDNVRLYLLLRKLLRSRHIIRENEYRRHVTMKTVVEGREEIVNIDIITNYYLFQREFIVHVKGIVDGRVEVELQEGVLTSPQEPAWMKGDENVPEVKTETVVHRTPPKRSTIKVRPVGAPPRKRAPRPKKYKIQIPGKDSITLPYQYDPRFRKEMEKEKARLRAEKEAKEQKAKRRLVKKRPVKAKKRAAKKVVKRKKIVKKAPKKARKRAAKKIPKKTVRKKAVRKVKKVKRSTKKRPLKKRPAKKINKGPKPVRTVKRFFRKAKRRVKKAMKS